MRTFALSLATVVVFGASVASWGSVLPDPGLFGEAVPVLGLPIGGASMSLDPGGNYMVFHSGSGAALKEAHRNGNVWTPGDLSLGSGGLGWETWPSLGPDGNWLFYNVSSGGFAAAIYRSVRQPNGEWGPGAALEGGIESFAGPGTPMFYENRLYLRQGSQGGSGERIFVSEYDPDTDTFGYPEDTEFANINDGSNNMAPYVTDHGKTLLFQSDRDGTYDIWMSTRDETEEPWDTPIKPDWPINSDGDDYSPWYSQANSTLYFSRDQGAYQSKVIPEPSTFLVWGTLGGLCLLACAWRRRKGVA